MGASADLVTFHTYMIQIISCGASQPGIRISENWAMERTTNWQPHIQTLLLERRKDALQKKTVLWSYKKMKGLLVKKCRQNSAWLILSYLKQYKRFHFKCQWWITLSLAWASNLHAGESVFPVLQSSCVVSTEIRPRTWRKDGVVNRVRFVSPDAALRHHVVSRGRQGLLLHRRCQRTGKSEHKTVLAEISTSFPFVY